MINVAKTEYYVVRRGSTSLTNEVVLSGLSYEAVGLLMTELSLRPGTPLGYREMVGRGAGRQRILNAHKELEAAGFRHRFLLRTAGGELKTTVVVTDTSMPSVDVLDEIALPSGSHLVKIETDSNPVMPRYEGKKYTDNSRHISRSHRATETGARSEQAESEGAEAAGPKEQVTGKTAGGTVVPETVARSTGAGRSPNTLRVMDSPPSPQPPTESGASGTAAPSGAEPAGSAGEGSSLQWTNRLAAISLALIGQGRLPEGVTDDELAHVRALQAEMATQEDTGGTGIFASDEDVITPVESSRDSAAEADAQLELARQVLPAPMQAMGPTHLAKVGGELAKRLEAGWLPDQITAILASRQLPSQVRNLVALVLARLRDDVPVDQPPPAGTDWSAEPSDSPSSQRWSHTLADGRVVTRKDLDCGLLAIDFNHARQSGDWAGDDRMAFAVAVGIERYLTS